MNNNNTDSEETTTQNEMTSSSYDEEEGRGGWKLAVPEGKQQAFNRAHLVSFIQNVVVPVTVLGDSKRAQAVHAALVHRYVDAHDQPGGSLDGASIPASNVTQPAASFYMDRYTQVSFPSMC